MLGVGKKNSKYISHQNRTHERTLLYKLSQPLTKSISPSSKLASGRNIFLIVLSFPRLNDNIPSLSSSCASISKTLNDNLSFPGARVSNRRKTCAELLITSSRENAGPKASPKIECWSRYSRALRNRRMSCNDAHVFEVCPRKKIK